MQSLLRHCVDQKGLIIIVFLICLLLNISFSMELSKEIWDMPTKMCGWALSCRGFVRILKLDMLKNILNAFCQYLRVLLNFSFFDLFLLYLVLMPLNV